MIWQDHRIIAGGLRDQACADLLAARFLLQSRKFTINNQSTTFTHVVMAKCQQACEKLLKGYFLHTDRSFDPTAGHRPMTDTTELTEYQLQKRESFFVTVNRGNSGIVTELKWIESHAPHRPRPLIGNNPAPLAALPPGLRFPEWHRDRVRYDANAGELIVSDRITRDERQELLNVSADPAYNVAVNQACDDANNKGGLAQPLHIIPANSEYPFWSAAAGVLVTPAHGLDPRGHGIRAMKVTLAFFRTLSRSDPRPYTGPLESFFDQYSLSSDLDAFPET
ncbi:MAG: hypothetical protein K8S99_06160 [Planctomycetes bacterium]|nr:hypothetical protein [Planctomycetota bacterium]